jgi:hypothetical protein
LINGDNGCPETGKNGNHGKAPYIHEQFNTFVILIANVLLKQQICYQK